MIDLSENDYPVRIVMFTYNGDQYKLIQSVSCALNVFAENDVKIFIEDDGNNPISDIIRDELLKVAPDKIFYERTYFNRQKNLNGAECIQNMASIFMDCGADIADNEKSVIIKLDCDCLIANRDIFDELILNNETGAIGSSIEGLIDWWGCMYAFKGSLVRDLYNLVADTFIEGDATHEDWFFGSALGVCCAKRKETCFDQKILLWDGVSQSAKSKLYSWDFLNDKFEVTDERVEEILNHCSVIEMGDGLHRNNDVMDAREQRRLMLKFVLAISARAETNEHEDFHKRNGTF